MKIKEKEAISPVIGVILMVAITVVLAAVVYLWVTGLIGVGKSTPVTSVTVLGVTAGKYVVKVASVSSTVTVKAYEVTIIRGGSSLLTQNLSGVYSKEVNGIRFSDNNANGLLDAGDTLLFTKGDVSGTYREGDELVIVYVLTGSRSGGIGLVG